MPSELLALPRKLSVKILPRSQRLQSKCAEKRAAAAAAAGEEATVQPPHCQAVQPVAAVVDTRADGSDKLFPGERASRYCQDTPQQVSLHFMSCLARSALSLVT